MQKIISIFTLASVLFIGIPAHANTVEGSVPPVDTTDLAGSSVSAPVPPADTTDLSGTGSEGIPPADTTDLSTAQPSTPTNSNQGGGSSAPVTPGSQTGVSGSTGGFSSGSTGTGLPTGQSVLGASTGPTNTGVACKAAITQYMKLGKTNSTTEVAKLQVVLNAFMGKKLAITGTFDAATDAALREFQQANSKDILTPWVKAGLMDKEMPTGYAYKTTLWYINNRLCGGNNLPMPTLK